MTEAIQIATTTDSRDSAERIARRLIEDRLAACVQIVGPVTSVYRWQGAVEQSEEWLCLAKTLGDRYRCVEAAIREVHHYDCPEILATPVVGGSRDYLDWLADSLAGAGEGDDS